MNILILGGGLQGLCCGASLYGKGYQVDIISNDSQIVRSKFFNNVYTDKCSHNEDVYEILKNYHYDLLLPMGDVNVSFLSKHKEDIESAYQTICAAPDYNILSIVEDKQMFMSFCEKEEIPHPITVPLSADNIEECAHLVGVPALIKPNFSVGARGITRVETIEELQTKFSEISEQFGNCTLQELIDNTEYYYNVMLYRSKEGDFLGSAVIKIVRMYPINAGSSTCCVSVKNDELVSICKACLDKLNWVGMADFDVLQRLDTNEYKIIEINPRVPASLKGSMISGINFPEIILSDCLGLSIPSYTYSPNKVMRYLGTDLIWFIKSANRFKAKPSWFSFFGKNVYYQDIYREDFSTWWTWLVSGIKKIKKRTKKIR